MLHIADGDGGGSYIQLLEPLGPDTPVGQVPRQARRGGAPCRRSVCRTSPRPGGNRRQGRPTARRASAAWFDGLLDRVPPPQGRGGNAHGARSGTRSLKAVQMQETFIRNKSRRKSDETSNAALRSTLAYHRTWTCRARLPPRMSRIPRPARVAVSTTQDRASMQSDIDAQLNNFFEDAPAREFDVVLRGYDRHQVHDHLKQIDGELRQTREQIQAPAARPVRLPAPVAGAGASDLLRPRRPDRAAAAPRRGAGHRARPGRAGPRPTRSRPRPRSTPPSCAPPRRTRRPRSAPSPRARPTRCAPRAEREAEEIRSTARREADELTSTTEREVAKLRATADHEVAEKRADAEREIAKLRTTTEREVAQLRASTKRERDEILTTAKRQADEMRAQAQRVLEETEAKRAQDEAEFEIQLAARREEAERQEAERHATAQAATQKLVAEAEQRAATAEQRATKATQQAEQTRREADSHAKQLVANARKNADQVVSEAKAQRRADRLRGQVGGRAEPHGRPAPGRRADPPARQHHQPPRAAAPAARRRPAPGLRAGARDHRGPAEAGHPRPPTAARSRSRLPPRRRRRTTTRSGGRSSAPLTPGRWRRLTREPGDLTVARLSSVFPPSSRFCVPLSTPLGAAVPEASQVSDDPKVRPGPALLPRGLRRTGELRGPRAHRTRRAGHLRRA